MDGRDLGFYCLSECVTSTKSVAQRGVWNDRKLPSGGSILTPRWRAAARWPSDGHHAVVGLSGM